MNLINNQYIPPLKNYTYKKSEKPFEELLIIKNQPKTEKKTQINLYKLIFCFFLLITKIYIAFKIRSFAICFDVINSIFIYVSFLIHNKNVKKENSKKKKNFENHHYYEIIFLKLVNDTCLLTISILLSIFVIRNCIFFKNEINTNLFFYTSFLILFSNLFLILILLPLKKNKIPKKLFFNTKIKKDFTIINQDHIQLIIVYSIALIISSIILEQIPNFHFLDHFCFLSFSFLILDSSISSIKKNLKILLRNSPEGFLRRN